MSSGLPTNPNHLPIYILSNKDGSITLHECELEIKFNKLGKQLLKDEKSINQEKLIEGGNKGKVRLL